MEIVENVCPVLEGARKRVVCVEDLAFVCVSGTPSVWLPTVDHASSVHVLDDCCIRLPSFPRSFRFLRSSEWVHNQ